MLLCDDKYFVLVLLDLFAELLFALLQGVFLLETHLFVTYYLELLWDEIKTFQIKLSQRINYLIAFAFYLSKSIYQI